MKRNIIPSLALLAAITLVGLSTVIGAEELWVVKDGVLNKEALAPGATDNNYCSGKTVDGFHVTGPDTFSSLKTAKFGLG